jgi:hypothetical protein
MKIDKSIGGPDPLFHQGFVAREIPDSDEAPSTFAATAKVTGGSDLLKASRIFQLNLSYSARSNLNIECGELNWRPSDDRVGELNWRPSDDRFRHVAQRRGESRKQLFFAHNGSAGALGRSTVWCFEERPQGAT